MNKAIDKLAWLHIENRRVLCARSVGKSTFYDTGGKIDFGESDEEALVREIKGELSVDLDTTSLALFATLEAQADGKAEGVMVNITCYQGKYTEH
jgi:8-oxo-dGTP diphosphatase